ncbi:MAG: hypothetical protein A3F72_13805 [Bacteroidetes bacterium RIFCSPLOWO2_12_FULL_35_15]|nr:MAG: hypothetical protein A3F72_13805 [Bacteroidetes bacterium RIFCSPLOWO2_12_FULL_35_15]
MNELKAFIADNLSGFSPKAIPGFIFSFMVCAVLSFILGRLYVKYGNSLSNRKSFSRNFIVLAITTMFIISVVKSSLALSLGLVGALSIVRFRSAIKEPEELTYLFLTIAIGLGCGAGLTILTLIAFIGFMIVIWFNNRFQKDIETQNLYLTISSNAPASIDLKKIINELKKHCSSIKLKRSDENASTMEASFYVEFEDIEQLENTKNALKNIHPSVAVTFMDNTRDL